MADTPQTPTVAPVLESIGHAAGRHLVSPMVAAALDAPDTRRAIARTALVAGSLVGACVCLAIIIGRKA